MSEIHRIDSPEGRRYLYFSTIDNTYLGSPMSRFELLELLKSGEYVYTNDDSAAEFVSRVDDEGSARPLQKAVDYAALKSLYGGKTLSGNVGGQKREQEVLTPDWILDAVREAFGGSIDFDPCASSNPSCWVANNNITLPADSLPIDWTFAKSIYVNPPFNDLNRWLMKVADTADRKIPIVILFPFRPHRMWLWPSLRGAAVVFLHYNVKFKGHKNAFPAPLALATFNCELPDLGSRETQRIYP